VGGTPTRREPPPNSAAAARPVPTSHPGHVSRAGVQPQPPSSPLHAEVSFTQIHVQKPAAPSVVHQVQAAAPQTQPRPATSPQTQPHEAAISHAQVPRLAQPGSATLVQPNKVSGTESHPSRGGMSPTKTDVVTDATSRMTGGKQDASGRQPTAGSSGAEHRGQVEQRRRETDPVPDRQQTTSFAAGLERDQKRRGGTAAVDDEV